MAEEVEVFLEVRVGVGVVGAEAALLHTVPDFREKILNLLTLNLIDIFPIGLAVGIAPVLQFCHSVQRIDVRSLHGRQLVTFDCSASHAVECPFVRH